MTCSQFVLVRFRGAFLLQLEALWTVYILASELSATAQTFAPEKKLWLIQVSHLVCERNPRAPQKPFWIAWGLRKLGKEFTLTPGTHVIYWQGRQTFRLFSDGKKVFCIPLGWKMRLPTKVRGNYAKKTPGLLLVPGGTHFFRPLFSSQQIVFFIPTETPY